MEILTAVQRGSNVYVYNAKKQQIFYRFAGIGPSDGLKGFTDSTVSIQRGCYIYTYNQKGYQIGAKIVR